MRTIDEFGLSRHDVRKVLGTYDNLKVQSMIFDMDIDIETWSLTDKEPVRKPGWLERWKEKENGSDTKVYDFEH